MQKLHLNIQSLTLLSMVLILCLSVVSCDEPTTTVEEEPITTILPEESNVDELIALNDKEDVNQQTVELEDFSDYLSEDSEENVEKDLKPITVTDDDYDLRDDSDDLPEDVEIIAERKTPNAYYFDGDKRNILDDPENTAKGVEETTIARPIRQYNAVDEMFFVVAGAFRTEKNAQKKMVKLKSLGYEPKMIKFSDSEFQTVCVAKFKGQPDADSVVTELTEEYNIDAYVVKRRQ